MEFQSMSGDAKVTTNGIDNSFQKIRWLHFDFLLRRIAIMRLLFKQLSNSDYKHRYYARKDIHKNLELSTCLLMTVLIY